MTFGQEYLLLVVLMCIGVVQMASAYGGLRGLLFFKGRRFSVVLGMAMIIASMSWFFWDGGRNFPDTGIGIAGASQFALFVLGGFLALLVTFLVTSLIHFKGRVSGDTIEGLPSLRETTFVQALLNNLGMLWKLYRRLTRKYSSG